MTGSLQSAEVLLLL